MTTETDNAAFGGTHDWGNPAPPPPAPERSGAELFYLGDIGRVVTLRIATSAYKYEAKQSTPERPWWKFACAAVIKSDSANPGVEPRVVILTEEIDVLGTINAIAEKEGNPINYDLRLTKQQKTKENDWTSASVVASSVKDAGLSEHEISLLAEAQISTAGQVEATMRIVTGFGGGKKATPKPAASGAYDPAFDPFA